MSSSRSREVTAWGGPAIRGGTIIGTSTRSRPYLTVHNDRDDAVPYYQAIGTVTALRRRLEQGPTGSQLQQQRTKPRAARPRHNPAT